MQRSFEGSAHSGSALKRINTVGSQKLVYNIKIYSQRMGILIMYQHGYATAILIPLKFFEMRNTTFH